MFAKFFRPKWQSNKADVRIRAISTLLAEQPDQLEILARLAQTDQSPDVRKAAVARLQKPELLLRVMASEQDPSIRHVATDHLCKLVASDASTLSQEQQLSCIQDIQDQDLLTHIALHTGKAALQQAAVLRVRDESNLEVLTLNAQSAQMRRLAAERLESEAALERVGRQMRQRDKAVYRVTRDKLQQLRDLSRARDALQADRLERVERMEQLAAGELMPLYGARIDALSQEWLKLETSTDALQERFQQALQICLQRAAQMQAQADAKAQQQQRQSAYKEQSTELLQQLDAIEQRSREALAESRLDTAALGDELNAWQQQWDALAHADLAENSSTTEAPRKVLARIQGTADSAQALHQAQTDLQRLLAQSVEDASPAVLRKQQQRINQLLHRVNWPQALPQPDALKQAQQRLQAIETRHKALQEQEQSLAQALHEQLDRLEQAIREGHVKQASKCHERAAQALEMLNGSTAAALELRFKQLHAQLQELKDWQGYAVTPKKEQLCADMEALIDSPLEVTELAESIRRLQQQWKLLDSTDPFHAQAIWRRFKQASDLAYAPCEVYFQAQSERRRENLVQRGVICDQLESYIASIDWDQADWSAIDTISRAAKDEWKQYSPVDRGPGKQAQKRFNQLLQQLDGPLHEHYHACLELKRDLVDQLAALCDAEDPQAAAQQAKALQQEWKDAGKTFRSQEHRLWKQFRAHCDTLFSRLGDSQQRGRELRTEQRESAEQICHQLEQLLASPCSRAQLEQVLPRCISDFCELEEDFSAPYLRRFDDARQQLERQRADLAQLQDSAVFAALRQRIELCDTLETQLLTEAPDAAVLEQLQARWDTLDNCSSEYAELIEQRFALAQQVQQDPALLPELTDAAGLRLRQLCIQLEIALGLSSPEDDQALRLEYQMQRLQQALEQHSEAVTTADLQRLEYEWRCVPMAQRHPALVQRFYQPLEGLL
jgi:DNA repair protein SbcC/Rad50